MRIRCPFCDERDSSEFIYLGDANCRRPELGGSDGPEMEARFVDAVYLRDNPAGPHEELWHHGVGCRSWLRVRRDTRTHEIFSVDFVKETAS